MSTLQVRSLAAAVVSFVGMVVAAGTVGAEDLVSVAVDLSRAQIEIHSGKHDGVSTLEAARRSVEGAGRSLLVACNGGIYGQDDVPLGLLVAAGKELVPLSTGCGVQGKFENFYDLPPRGVFYVKDRRAGILATCAFADEGIHPDWAIQSGPMLVINGQVNPFFNPSGTNRFTRNALAVDGEGVVYVVFARDDMNLYDFSTKLVERTGAVQALYLDGAISGIIAEGVSVNPDRTYPSIVAFSMESTPAAPPKGPGEAAAQH